MSMFIYAVFLDWLRSLHDVFLALLKHAEAETVLKAGDNSLTSPGIPGLDQLLEFQELGHTDTNNSQFQLVDRFGLSFASPLELACRASTWAAFGWAMPLYGQFLRFLSCCWLLVWMYVDHGWWLVKNRHCHSQRLQVRSPLFIRGFAATHDHWFHGHLARVFLHAVTWLPMTGQAWGCCCCCCSFVFELIVATISGTYLNHDPCNSKVVHCTIQNWLAERFKTGWPNDSKLADRTVQ